MSSEFKFNTEEGVRRSVRVDKKTGDVSSYEEVMKDGKLCFRITPDDDFTPYTLEHLTKRYCELIDLPA